MKITNIKENLYVSGDFVVPVAQTDEFGITDWKGLPKSQLGGISIQLPKLNVQINKYPDVSGPAIADRRINVSHTVVAGDGFLSCNPKIVLVRKIKTKAIVGENLDRIIKKVKWGEPKGVYSSPFILDPPIPLSVDRDFQFDLQPTTQYYTPGTGDKLMTVENIVNPFVYKRIDGGNNEFHLLLGKDRKFGSYNPMNGNGRLVGTFGLCIRIENPNFVNLPDYPESTFNAREPKYIFGPITKIRVGVVIADGELSRIFASIT